MNCYFIYLRSSSIDDSLRKWIPYRLIYGDNSESYVLYAYTNKKKYVKRFLENRKDIFFVSKRNIDESEYNDILNNHNYELIETTLSNSDSESITMVIPRFEHEESGRWMDYFESKNNQFSYMNYETIDLFKREYAEAMGILGLSSLSMIVTMDDSLGVELFYDFLEFDADDRGEYLQLCPLNPFSLNANSRDKKYIIRPKSINIFINKFKSVLKEEI